MTTSNIQSVVVACTECMVSCERCADHFIGDAEMETCLRLCLECAG
ncbi:hypothetical protein [Stakelama marina]|uniref:Four-helix bundle copper-binding protein n=1 Tax=Stakelama marina TaxID=2826939 RepID=A0A8T4IEA4_9SPHN|nr:hypothetical protein [Stakelama marina]MBR0552781.1 hypothetical protein [Stakelama marina]